MTLVFGAPLLLRDKLPNSVDLAFSSAMTQALVDGIRDQKPYPTWVDLMNLGYGAPAFSLYPPLSFYISGGLTVLTGEVVTGLRWSVLLSVFFSGLAFFVMARPMTSELGATVGAVLYIVLPFHYLEIYVRWAYAAAWSLVFLPLVFRFAWDVTRADPRSRAGLLSAAGLAASFAALCLTHLMTAYLVLLCLAPFVIVHLFWARQEPVKNAMRLAIMAVAGLTAVLSCSFYLAPVLLERSTVNFDYYTATEYGTWTNGLLFQPSPNFFNWERPLTLVNASVASMALLALVALILAFRFLNGDAKRQALLLGGLTAWTIFLQTPLSILVWVTVPYIQTAQFPWRFGSQQIFFTALLVAVVTPALSKHRVALAGLMVACVPALIVSASFVDRKDYTIDEEIVRGLNARTKIWSEFVPKAVDPEMVYRPEADIGQRFRLLGQGQGKILAWTSHGRLLRLEGVENPTSMIVRTFAYPGWEARVDGAEVPIRPSGPLGLIQVPIPAGTEMLVLRYTETPARRLGVSITKVMLALLAVTFLVAVLRSRRSSLGKAGT